MMKVILFYALLTLLGVSKSQYIAISPKPSKFNQCDNLSSTALIERFFDLIFTEFHRTPPACVCVQMCAEQPTYCYPNGCLKRAEKKKVEDIAVIVNPGTKGNFEGTTVPAMFGVDHRAIVDDLFERPGLLMMHEDTAEKLKPNDLIRRPSPFKELVLKYKKVPKLEMKYNLREQVTNTKSEKLNKEKNVDISKTRWPSNKHLLHGKSLFNKACHHRKNDDTMQVKFFSMAPNHDPLSHSPINYNKYLTKRDNNNGVNGEALDLYQNDTTDFTLETLIDNLIENSMYKTKKDIKSTLKIKDDRVKQASVSEINFTEIDFLLDENNETKPIIDSTANLIENSLYKTKKDIRSTLNVKDDRVKQESTSEINFTEIDFLLDENNDTNPIIDSTAVNIVSMNSTNENTDENIYSHDMNMTNKNTFLEMIASMTKEIEKQNKANLEFMERATGVKRISYELTRTNSTKATNLSITESILKKANTTKVHVTTITEKIVPVEDLATTQNIPVTKTTTYKTKAAKQRIVRKLKRRKLN